LNQNFASETIQESSKLETLKVENDLPPKNVETLYSNFLPVGTTQKLIICLKMKRRAGSISCK
jgi:hypothetical protein